MLLNLPVPYLLFLAIFVELFPKFVSNYVDLHQNRFTGNYCTDSDETWDKCSL